jgi:hypothetical protein
MTRRVTALALLMATFAFQGGFLNPALGARISSSAAGVLQALTSQARLMTAGEFAILAGSTITNSGVTTISGDVGLDPGTAITGFAPCPAAPTPTTNCVVLDGATHISDGVSLQAKTELVAAYNGLLTHEATCTPVGVELATTTYLPGVYCSPTFNLSTNGTVTLDANGDPDAEFIFLTGAGGSTLVTGSGGTVLLINGAQACNVYWQVASSATVGVGSAFAGNILAAQSISLLSGATVQGRVLAQNGAVTLDHNTVSAADCRVVPPSTSTPSTSAPGSSAPSTSTTATSASVTSATSASVTSAPATTTTPTVPPTTPSTSVTSASLPLGGQTATASSTLLTRRLTEAGASSGAGQAEQRVARGTSEGLAATGAAVRPKLIVAVLAIGLGCLLVALSQRRRRLGRRRSVAPR